MSCWKRYRSMKAVWRRKWSFLRIRSAMMKRLSGSTATFTVLEEGVGIGRKLDFIAQEMNREANTILSKSSDLEVSNLAIDLKTEIEKVREQIQNIE